MAKILSPKVEATGLVDVAEMAALKTIGETILTPVIGNGSITSGAIKLAMAGLGAGLSKNKHLKLAASALAIDAVEDIAHTVMPRILGKTVTAEAAW